MVDLTVLKFKLEFIIRSVVDASGGPPIFRQNCGRKGRKMWFFLDLPLTSGSGWPGHILFWRSGSASEYQVLLYSWDSFPNCMRSHWLLQGHMMISNNKIACNVAKSMTSVGNSALLPANVDRRLPFRFVFTLRLLMSSFCYILTNHLMTGPSENIKIRGKQN